MATSIIEKPAPTGEGLTFEKVWAALQESAKEFDRKMQEDREKHERRKEEADRRMEKMDRLYKKLGKQMGELNNRFGEVAEHLVAPGIRARFNELGYHFGEVLPGGVKIYGADGKIKTQIDLLLENDETVMAIEVKTKVNEKDAEHHLKRLEILRDFRHKKNDRRKIRGGIAGAVFGEIEKKAVIEAGLYVIGQTGDTMTIEVPDGFIPGEW